MIGHQRGFALIIASLALLVVASVALLLVTESGMGQTRSASDVERTQLDYVTEAGVAHARWALAQSTECKNYPTITKAAFGSDNYDVVFNPTSGSPTTVAVKGELANGVYRTASLMNVRAYDVPQTITLQLGKDPGKDAILDDFYDTRNYGGSSYVSIESKNWIQRPVLQFDLSDIPSGVKITSANLELRAWNVNTPGVVTVHRLTRDWQEGTRNGGGQSDGADWQTYDGTNAWSTPGGEFDPMPYGSASVVSATWTAWEIGDLVQGWVSGDFPNQGLLLNGDGVISNASFAARETNNLPDAPKLTITYACECGKVCGPGTAGSVLLVVPDPSNLSAQLQTKKALIESWNYTVNLIDESATLTDFDAAFAANDVVYVPQEITSSALDTKLFKAEIGVVNEEGEQVDELGFSQSKIFKSRDEIDVVDNTHYITEPFASGLLTFVSSTQSVHMLSGTTAGGLQTLGETLNTGSLWKPSLAVLEKDSAVYGGGNAWGRRVQLPWGGGTFDIEQLTDDGRTIMERAIEWAAGAGASGPTLVGHWKLDDAAGSTAVDSSLRGNDGTLAGDPDWTSGYLAGALAFDQASSDRVLVPDAPSLDITDAITLTAWIKPNATGTQYVIRKAQFGSTDGYELSLSTAGKVFFRLNQQSQGDTWRIESTSSYPADGATWMHIAATYDGVTQRLYINGAEEASQPASIGINTNDTDLSLGGQVDGTRVIDGIVDDVRLYSSALSAAEIAELAAETRTGPIAHWMLDDGTGTTAVDSAGGNDGTLFNWPATPTWVAGVLNGGLSFDGSNDRVDVGTFDVAGSGLTLMGWFNADALPDTTDPRLISKASSTAEADAWWQLSILTNAGTANIRLRAKAGGTTSTLVDSSTSLNAGEWYFAVGTYDAATGEMKLYLNGIEVASQIHPVAGPLSTNGSVPVALGANGSPEQFFDGVLDDLRIYDRALSASEIADRYAAGGGGGGGGGGSPTILEVRVATGNDDAEEFVSNGSVNLTSSDVELISDAGNAQLVGMRFTNVTVPGGATISNAYVQFQVDETNTGATSLTIQGQAIDDAPTFTSASTDISSRGRTTASASWTPVAWNTVGEAGPDQRTPDIKSIIQEIVDRPGWTSGNDIVIIFTGSGERTAESYNGSASAAPLLHIEY